MGHTTTAPISFPKVRENLSQRRRLGVRVSRNVWCDRRYQRFGELRIGIDPVGDADQQLRGYVQAIAGHVGDGFATIGGFQDDQNDQGDQEHRFANKEHRFKDRLEQRIALQNE